MRLIIVRHGQTGWNEQGRLQGITDKNISKIGLLQAKSVAKELAKEKIGMIYTSKLKRAVRTAEEIKKFHKNIKIIKAKELNEMSWGIWEGLTWNSIKKNYSGLYEIIKNNRFNFKVPEGESLSVLKARLDKFLKKIAIKNKDRTLLIVGHLNVNRILIGILLKWSNQKIASTKIYNASITIIDARNGTSKLTLFNSHMIPNGSLPR